MYEGTPDTPHQGRLWEIVEKYKVTILYTAPTAIRTFMKWGDDIPAKYDLSLAPRPRHASASRSTPRRGSGTASTSAADTAPIVDTWWQTETGAIMISPLPGVTTLEPGSAQKAIPGVSAEILDDDGQPFTEAEQVGYLVLTKPWPSMLRGIWGDPERYKETYWSRFGPKYYFAGDGAKYDAEGNIWLLGRVDDVMNVSGHRLSTAEIESALVSHPRWPRRRSSGPPTRRPARPSVPSSSCAATRPTRARRPSRSCATTWPRRSARSPSRARSWSSPSCRRPAPARSCAASSRTSPRTARSAMSTTLADSSVMNLIQTGAVEQLLRLTRHGAGGAATRGAPRTAATR